MAEHPSEIVARPAGRGWPRWLAALLFGLLLLLTLLIASWFLRACVPVDPSTNLTTFETPAPPAPPPPADPTSVLKASLDDAAADEKKLKAVVDTGSMMAPLYLSGFLYLTHAFRASHERGHKNEEAYHRAALTFLCLLDCSRNPKLELLHNPRTKQERDIRYWIYSHDTEHYAIVLISSKILSDLGF